MNEGYIGVKFKMVYKNKEAPQHPNLELLKAWCRVFHEKGLEPPYPEGSYGNLSFRTERNSFIITGICIGLKDTLSNDCFVEIHDCNTETKEILLSGTRPPSSETFIHFTIYQSRPDVNAVFHGHNPRITDNASLLGIPETAEEVPYGTVELAESVKHILGSNNFIVIKQHGFVSVERTMHLAGAHACDWMEKTSEH
jgi:ribulose-5-phosphate 4-epimerase/fuculose-1-phosphate aldolase